MLVYKALYRKMMDDLKDAGMWLDWAEQISHEHPEQAEFLVDSAEERLEKSFPHTYEHFKKICEGEKSGVCVDSIVHDHMMEWCQALKMKLHTVQEMMDDDDHEKPEHVKK